eukprot:3949469-Heterocapsa_arctica.AAC.1
MPSAQWSDKLWVTKAQAEKDQGRKQIGLLLDGWHCSKGLDFTAGFGLHESYGSVSSLQRNH